MVELNKENGPELPAAEEPAGQTELPEDPTPISPVEAEVKISSPRLDSYHPCFGGRMEGGLPRRR